MSRYIIHGNRDKRLCSYIHIDLYQGLTKDEISIPSIISSIKVAAKCHMRRQTVSHFSKIVISYSENREMSKSINNQNSKNFAIPILSPYV